MEMSEVITCPNNNQTQSKRECGECTKCRKKK